MPHIIWEVRKLGTIPSVSLDVLAALMHKKGEKILFIKRYVHMGCKPWGEASEQIWTLVCLLTWKQTVPLELTQGSFLTEMSYCCHSHFKMEVRDFDRQEGRNKEGPQRWACKVSNSTGWKQRNKIIGDSAVGKKQKTITDLSRSKNLMRGGREEAGSASTGLSICMF